MPTIIDREGNVTHTTGDSVAAQAGEIAIGGRVLGSVHGVQMGGSEPLPKSAQDAILMGQLYSQLEAMTRLPADHPSRQSFEADVEKIRESFPSQYKMIKERLAGILRGTASTPQNMEENTDDPRIQGSGAIAQHGEVKVGKGGRAYQGDFHGNITTS